MISIKLPGKQNSFSQQRNKTMLKVGIAIFLKIQKVHFAKGGHFSPGMISRQFERISRNSPETWEGRPQVSVMSIFMK